MVTEQDVIAGLRSYYQELDESVTGRPPQWRHRRNGWSAGSWKMQLLATAALLLLLIGAGVLIHEARLLNGKAPVTTHTSRTAAYQNMVSVDFAKFSAFQPLSCASVQDSGCPLILANFAEAGDRALNDFDSVPPPPEFAQIAAELRQHLRLFLTDYKSAEVAFGAADQRTMLASENSAANEVSAIDLLANDVIRAISVSATDYRQQIELLLENLQVCREACQAVLLQPNAICPAAAECMSSEVAMQGTLEEIQGALASHIPPAFLSRDDSRLENDLVAAHAALDQMIMLNGNPRNVSSEYSAAQRSLASAIDAFSTEAHRILGH
jgi:hypothetical protein